MSCGGGVVAGVVGGRCLLRQGRRWWEEGGIWDRGPVVVGWWVGICFDLRGGRTGRR